MKSILFVCLGNISRSPVAEAVARHEFLCAGLDIFVDSAGTADYHIGEQADRRSIASAAVAGYDATPHRARQVCAADFQKFDAVLAMDNSNLRELNLRCPAPFKGKVDLFLRFAGVALPLEVPDPYYGTTADFEYVVALARQGTEKLISRLRDVA